MTDRPSCHRDHEYLTKEETRIGAPRPPRAIAADGLFAGDRGGFSFGGHRLSSLYRAGEGEPKGLRGPYGPASSLCKYSGPPRARVIHQGAGA
jgi:hypothetical protein